MHYARKKDNSHNTIITDLRAVGAEVEETYRAPGLLDCIVGYRGKLYWAEIKNNARTAEKDLTEAERALIARFAAVGVRLYVWSSADQALRDIGAIQ
jgi:hypothetical protein